VQHITVDAVEELADIELQCVLIGLAFAQCGLRVIGGCVRAIAFTACKRLADKTRVKDRLDYGINGVLYYQITEGGGEDSARFWLVHHKAEIRTGLIPPRMQLIK